NSKGRLPGGPSRDPRGGRGRAAPPLSATGWSAALGAPPAGARPEDSAAAPRRTVARGHVALKLDPFHEMVPYHTAYLAGQITAAGEEFGVAAVAAVRGAGGPEGESLIDAHRHYTVPDAGRPA